MSLMWLLFSCNNAKSFDNKEDLIEYIQNDDNGYSQTKQINGIKINLTYRPTELMVTQEIGDHNYPQSYKDSIKAKYDKCLYFILSYSKNDKEILLTVPTSREQYNLLQNTLTFEMNTKVALTAGRRDTIPLINFNFPRTYGTARSNNILFVFEKPKNTRKSNNIQFNVHDIGLGIGDIKFSYAEKTIKNQNLTIN